MIEHYSCAARLSEAVYAIIIFTITADGRYVAVTMSRPNRYAIQVRLWLLCTQRRVLFHRMKPLLLYLFD